MLPPPLLRLGLSEGAEASHSGSYGDELVKGIRMSMPVELLEARRLCSATVGGPAPEFEHTPPTTHGGGPTSVAFYEGVDAAPPHAGPDLIIVRSPGQTVVVIPFSRALDVGEAK